MIPFAAKCSDGKTLLGFAVSDADLMRLRAGGHAITDLSSCDVGIWIKEADGGRTFIQPRDSKIVVIAGDTVEDIGQFLKVDLK